MNPKRLLFRFPHLKSSVVRTLLSATMLTLCAFGVAPGTAQSPEQEATPAADSSEERKLHDAIPSHLPVKIKVKNLNNKKWLQDLEIEVKNTGQKPIYYLLISLYFMDVKQGRRRRDWLPFTLREA